MIALVCQRRRGTTIRPANRETPLPEGFSAFGDGTVDGEGGVRITAKVGARSHDQVVIGVASDWLQERDWQVMTEAEYRSQNETRLTHAGILKGVKTLISRRPTGYADIKHVWRLLAKIEQSPIPEIKAEQRRLRKEFERYVRALSAG